MEAGQKHDPTRHVAGEVENLGQALRQLALLQRRIEVEEALERVRARAMVMHTSDELTRVAEVCFAQFSGLEIPALRRVVIFVMNPEAETMSFWASSESDQPGMHRVTVPMRENATFREISERWLAHEDRFSIFFEGKTLKDFVTHIVQYGWRYPAGESPANRMVWYFASYSYGFMTAITYEPITEEDFDILQRFALVFKMAYTRFEDLQQAEARAREAIQQASLDRVRAEIASMRTAHDLERITPLVWRELTTLGVPFFRCGVFIIDEATQTTHTYLSTPDGTSLAALHLPFDSSALTQEVVAHWGNRQVYTHQWDREQFKAWVAALVEEGYLDSIETYQGGKEPPEQLALHFLPFTQGMLYVGSAAPLPDDQLNLVQNLADAFSVAYARYEDFTQLEAAKVKVEATLADLKITQAQLVQAEKMASLGQLTAGIAHEIKNPLNFVNNFAELSVDLADELREDLAQHPEALAAVEDVLVDLKQNAGMIAHHGKRADGIVRAMMQHASGGSGQREATDLNQLVSDHVDLAYHGKQAQEPTLQIEIERTLGHQVGQVEIVPQEIGRVLLNLLGNAFDAVHEHPGSSPGQALETGYVPTVEVSTRRVGDTVEIRVSDNGPGIPTAIREKIFEPFFTTKPTGSGTGLGLSMSYDIVTQGHGGMLTVESKVGEGTTFIVTLPLMKQSAPDD